MLTFDVLFNVCIIYKKKQHSFKFSFFFFVIYLVEFYISNEKILFY